MSPRVNRFFLRLDYAGVCLLIAGSTFPLYYYGFYCHSTLAMIYLSIIGFSCLVVFFVSL
jgi:adiponectin receptor